MLIKVGNVYIEQSHISSIWAEESVQRDGDNVSVATVAVLHMSNGEHIHTGVTFQQFEESLAKQSKPEVKDEPKDSKTPKKKVKKRKRVSKS